MFKKLTISLSAAALIGLSSAASALPVVSNGANNSLAAAQSINGFFDLASNPQIANSTTIPHAEIYGVGDDTFDFYSFTVGVDNTNAVFDIDCGYQTLGSPNTGCDDRDDFFDAYLDLYTAAGIYIDSDDDDFSGDPGSENTPFDPLLAISLDQGDYVIRVGAFFQVEIPDGADYILNVSLEPPRTTVPAPGMVLLFGLGLLALGATRRRTR